ncbi:hypothetical protein K438DRAFT_1976747 [Mycena galopus ATCC 62051]|nr:hypothetical protein K438DRAFT_1976747 [Mycena galopus ATCC 62051]
MPASTSDSAHALCTERARRARTMLRDLCVYVALCYLLTRGLLHIMPSILGNRKPVHGLLGRCFRRTGAGIALARRAGVIGAPEGASDLEAGRSDTVSGQRPPRAIVIKRWAMEGRIIIMNGTPDRKSRCTTNEAVL